MNVEGPLSASAYALLGVAASSTDEDLRRAYRLRLRETHPDTGGEAAHFVAVQHAWELVGTPLARAAYDRERVSVSTALLPPSQTGGGTRPRGRSHGHPGAWRRAQYRRLVDEQHARPLSEAEAYTLETAQTAGSAARTALARAIAEESAALLISHLGIGYTAWHGIDVARSASGHDSTPEPGTVLDHLVLGPRGLVAVNSDHLGGAARFRHGELRCEADADRQPLAELLTGTHRVMRAAKVRVDAAVITLADEHLPHPVTLLGPMVLGGSGRGILVVVARRAGLSSILREGVPGMRALGGTTAFEVRTRLQQRLRLLGG